MKNYIWITGGAIDEALVGADNSDKIKNDADLGKKVLVWFSKFFIGIYIYCYVQRWKQNYKKKNVA